MGLSEYIPYTLRVGRAPPSMFDLVGIVSGYMVGHAESKGVPLPTAAQAFLAVWPALSIAGVSALGLYNAQLQYRFARVESVADALVTLDDGRQKRMHELTPFEARHNAQSVMATAHERFTELPIPKPAYARTIARNSGVASLETAVGYVLGRIVGSL